MLTCASAGGTFSKLYVIYPGKRPKFNLTGVNPADFTLGSSVNGWMTADNFFELLANYFFLSIRDKVSFPVVLFLDGHCSHVTIASAQFCHDNNIILFCLPPHASHILQPLDVAVFGPMKKMWNVSIEEFKKKYMGLSMSKAHFFPVFQNCWSNSTSAANVKAGFKKCGLVPFNADAVGYDRLIVNAEVNTPQLKNSKPITDQEKVGLMYMHQGMLSCIPSKYIDMFEKHRTEGYDIEDDSFMHSLEGVQKII